jgi:repressor LexA
MKAVNQRNRIEHGADARVEHGEDARDALTSRQQQVLEFINRCIDERGYPPTLREIGKHMSIRSTNGVNDHLKALERKGYLKREDLKSRALRPVTSDSALRVPVLGQVAAGQPVLAAEDVETTLRMDPALLDAKGDLFALRVRGESMIEDGIHEGDYVFVQRQQTARKGQTVVALIDDEATVKRYYPDGDRIRLQPANSSMEPIYINAAAGRDVSILGIVVGVFRKLSSH